MLSLRSQIHRLYILRFYLCEMFRIDKSIKTESRFVVARGTEECGMTDNDQMSSI